MCILCGKPIPAYKQIAHRNSILANGLVFCTECVTNPDKDLDETKDILRILNIPFIIDLWKEAEERSEKMVSQPISEYLKIIVTQRRKYKDFMDSEFQEKNKPVEIFEINEELIGRWGTLDEKEQYIDLETSYQDLIKLKLPMSSVEDRQYVEAVRIGARLREEIAFGKASDIKSLKQAYAESLQDIGLDNATLYNRDGEKGIGEYIQKFEATGPLPEMAPEFRDVDRILDYIRVLFTNSMKRSHGKASEDEIAELQSLRDSIIPRGDVSGY